MTKINRAVKFQLIVLAVLSAFLGAYLGPVFVLTLFAAVKNQEKLNNRAEYVINILWVVLVMYFTYAIPRCMLHSQYPPDINLLELVLNMLCVFVVCAIVYIFIGRVAFSVISGSFLLVLLSTANAVIYGLRGKELGPMDFLSVATAANVAGQYNLRLNFWIIASIGLWLLAVLLLKSLPKFPKTVSHRSRLYVFAVTIISVIVLIAGAANKPVKTWETEGTRLNGYYLNFYIAMRDSAVKAPDGYSDEKAERYAQRYTVQNENGSRPDIIVIMNESYVDFAGAELNVSVTPFLDSCNENIIRGHALTSVYGGNTANSEFEFLTGHSMAFLPESTVPYQQYIDSNIYSLAQYMGSCGYKTVATHPYFADGWSRQTVYPLLGFSEYSFIESYPAKRLIRDYISDREMFEHIIDYSNDTEEPLFVFGITMQNHGGYDFDGENFTNTVKLEGFSKSYPLAEQYLSLLRETDKAVEYLITALENRERDTVVLFFGDHFPNLENGFYEELYGEPLDTPDKQMLQYTVPFFVWANYDIDERIVECTSLSYLSNYLLEAAGLELPPYNQALKEIEKTIPAINANGYFSKTENRFIAVNDATGEEEDCLNLFSILQYNNLFDERNRNYNLFGRYMIQ